MYFYEEWLLNLVRIILLLLYRNDLFGFSHLFTILLDWNDSFYIVLNFVLPWIDWSRSNWIIWTLFVWRLQWIQSNIYTIHLYAHFSEIYWLFKLIYLNWFDWFANHSLDLFGADAYTVILETRPVYGCFLNEDTEHW